MIYKHQNEEGYVFAYIEWDVVDDIGKNDEYGLRLLVKDLWVHPDYDGETAIKRFIIEASEDYRIKYVKFCYWVRERYGQQDRPSRLFSWETVVRKGKSNVSFFKRFAPEFLCETV